MPKDRSSDGWCTDLSKVTYIYDPAAWPTNPKTTCFVCKKDGEKDKLLSCGLTIAKSPCPIRFHRNCLLKYNGGGFDFVGLRKNCQKLSCPLHHCSYCLLHRLLTSTTSFDDDISLVTCTECLQSFHKPCIPGGVIVTKKNLIPGDPKSLSETIVCPHHVKVKLSDKPRRLIATLRGNKRQRLPICCECDNELKGELVPCSKCIRMYHPGCHRFKTRVGPDGKHDPIDGLCEGCILGEFVRHEAPAIALYKGRFYPCETVDISLYPRKTNGDPFRQGLGKPGFVTIRWAGMDKTFACYPHEFVCPLTPASYNAYGKTLHDKEDYRKAWKKLSENCGARRVPLPPSKYTEITKSEYFDKSSPPVFRLMNFHEFRCDCKKGQCKADTCTNIQVDLRECPEDCQIADESGNTRPCNNRQVTEGRMFEGLKMGPAGSKGLGVYATMSILKGTCLGEYAGEIINLREKARRVKKLQKEKDNDEQHYMMDLGPTLVVDCRHKGNIARFINHSCEPNCVPHVIDIVTGVTMGKDPKYKVEKRCAIFTLRNIKEGEELTFDYRMEEHEGSSKPKCSCNSKRCTGFMDGRQKTSLQRGRKRKNEESLSESKTEETITSPGDRDAGKDSVVIKTLLKNYAGNKPDNETDAAKENIESKRAARLAKRKNAQDKSIPLSPSKKQIKLEEEPI